MRRNTTTPWQTCIPMLPTTRRQKRHCLPGTMPTPILMVMNCRITRIPLNYQALQEDDEDRKILIPCF